MGYGRRILSSVFFAVLLFPFPLAALDWPVEHHILTATFGENRGDHFHDGIDIDGGNQPIHPAADGQVLYTYDEGSDPRALPTGLGSFIVIQHDKELRTLYAHLEKGTVLRDQTKVAPSQVIGIMGDTGDSVGRHLHFEVIDQAKGEIINPLTVLPPLADSQRPVISSVSIERKKQLTTLLPSMVLDSGQVTLVIDAYDPSQYVQYFDPMAPYEIEATLNGQELFNITYDSLKFTNGSAYLAPAESRTFVNYYLGTWTVRLGTFTLNPGTARLLVTVRDIVGNETTRSFDITVRAATNQ